MKLALAAATLVLVAGGATGCGDDGDGGGASDRPPSVAEFCGALKEFRDDFADQDPSKDLKGYIRSLKAAADKLEDVGTPKDTPADARDGFELTITKIKDLSDDATVDDLASMGDVSDEEQKLLDALDEYIDKTCPDLESDPSQSPSG